MVRISHLWVLASCCCVAFATAETIHFTNSPGHLLGSKNFTTYKLHVKDSAPITIIEASKEVSSPGNDDFHFHSNERIDYGLDGREKLVASIGASHQAEKLDNQEVRTSLGFTVDTDPDPNDSLDSRNEYKVNGAATVNGVGIKKLVYSPALLKKFVKEYTEKLKNADTKTKNAIQEIHEKIHGNKNEEDIEPEKDSEPEQKYNYNSFHDNFNRRPTSASSSSQKDPSGWVTLEAVPWSSSSVSKWHAHDTKKYDDRRRPTFSSTASHDRPYSGGSRPNNFPYDDDEDDYYNRPKPANIDRNSRPNVFSTWTKPQSLARPQRPQYDYGQSESLRDKFYDRPSSGRPWNDEIITDNRPSDFPDTENYDSHRHPYNHNNNNHNEGYERDHYHSSTSNSHSAYTSRPNEGNGEWVLISTTKGYQVPNNRRQHGKRSMSMSAPVAMNAAHIVDHKAVKLTVLPAIGSQNDGKNSTFSSDAVNMKPTMISSYGGMIEVEATNQTVEEHVKATAQSHSVSANTKPNKKDNKRRKVLKGN